MDDTIEGVIAGFDCHLDNHAAVLISSLGRIIDKRRIQATTHGYREAIEWAGSFGPLIAAGVESTGSYGAGLARHLMAAGVKVIEINQPHPHTRARRGKNDFIDAEAAARKVLSGEATAVAKDTTGVVEAIRLLQVARSGAVKSRTAAMNQLHGIIATSPAALRERLTHRKTIEAKAAICTLLRPASDGSDPTWAAKTALRSIARRIKTLDEEIAALDIQLERLVAVAAPTLIDQLGISTGHAATMLVAIGENADRLRSEGAFANLCGVAPKQASSGRTNRHRLNPGGNRQANRALHMIVIVRLRYCTRTRAYMTRRTAEGLSKKETIRCLKRYVAREIHHILRSDLATIAQRT